MPTSSPCIPNLWCNETFKEPRAEKPFQYIDLTLSSNGEINEASGSLTAKQVEDWVNEAGKFKRPDDDNGGLRLLVGSAMNELRHNLKPWSFSVETARLLFERFDLMDTFFHACKTGNRVISSRPSHPGSPKKPSWMLRQTHHAAAVSYCTQTNRVCGVVLAGSQGQQNSVEAQNGFISKVRELKEYACHPLLLPYVVLSKEADRLDAERSADNLQVLKFEDKTGLRENRRADEEFIREMEIAMQGIVECLAMISNHRADAEILEKNFEDAVHQGMAVFEEAIQHKRQSQDEDADDSKALVIRDNSILMRMQLHSQDLECRFKYLFDCNRSAAASFKALQKRVETQMEGLFMNHTNKNSRLNLQMANDSARVASASHRDSSSMKVIALITTLFMPATFIATVGGIQTVNLQFWIYLAISIPLTFVVMVLVYAWMRRINKRNESDDNRAEKGIGIGSPDKAESDPSIGKRLEWQKKWKDRVE